MRRQKNVILYFRLSIVPVLVPGNIHKSSTKARLLMAEAVVFFSSLLNHSSRRRKSARTAAKTARCKRSGEPTFPHPRGHESSPKVYTHRFSAFRVRNRNKRNESKKDRFQYRSPLILFIRNK